MVPRGVFLIVLVLVACGGSQGSCGGPRSAPGLTAPTLIAAFDLPRTSNTEALSAIVFDEPSRTLFALQDTAPRLVPLVGSADYASWSVAAPVGLTGRPESPWDGEGLARTKEGDWLVVATEKTPLIERYSATAAYLGPIETPPRFREQHPGSVGIESLTVSPSGRYLFFANEAALRTDGPLADPRRGTLIRILRRDLTTGIDEERAYRTDPTSGGEEGSLGVSELAAMGDEDLLVLERGYQPRYGNTARIYRTDLASGPDVSAVHALDESTTTVTKRLVVDLGTLPSSRIVNASPQPNPILDNYEGLALGPWLPDGRRLVFVVSDDNQRASQVARVLTLALPL